MAFQLNSLKTVLENTQRITARGSFWHSDEGHGILEAIWEARNRGADSLSFAQIADVLNEAEAPSPSNKPWTTAMVVAAFRKGCFDMEWGAPPHAPERKPREAGKAKAKSKAKAK